MAQIKLIKLVEGTLKQHDNSADDITFNSIDVTESSNTIGGIAKENLLDKTAAEQLTGDWDFSGGKIQLPKGTEAPGANQNIGDIFWDTDDKTLSVYDGSSWYAMFKNFTVEGNGSGSSQTISDGNTLTITGGTGVTTVASATNTVTINGNDATDSTKGIASFHSDNFGVSSGEVTIKDGGVANVKLAYDGISIDADSGGSEEVQLGDTLMFAGGTGIDTARTTDTITVAVDTTIATKSYVNNTVDGMSWQESVIDGVEYIKTDAGAPSGSGATSGEKCLNTNEDKIYEYTSSWDVGSTLSSGDRYINKDDGSDSSGSSGTYTADDQIYEYNGSSTTGASPSDGWAMFIESGGEADTGWNYNGSAWVQWSGASQITAGAGLTKDGNTINAIAGDTSITVNADEFHVNLAHNFTWTGNHDFTTGTFSLDGTELTTTATEINQALDGITTDVTPTNLNTLTGGSDSDASALHTHESGGVSFTAAAGGIAQYDAVYITAANNTIDSADANAIGSGRVIGIAPDAIDGAASGIIVTSGGVVNGCGSSWTAGSDIFLAATEGGLTDQAPTGSTDVVIRVGIAINTTDLFVQIGPPVVLA